MIMDFASLHGAAVLAPMAGLTDCTFRSICADMGCRHGTTEMVSANGLVMAHGERIQAQLMTKAPGERVGVQIFGRDPSIMERAAEMVAPDFDFVDINLGCPAPAIVQGGAGAALGRDRGLARLVIQGVMRGAAAARPGMDAPVTVKMRLGWDDKHLNYLEMAEMVAETGAAALAVHGRTKAQMYSGKADMEAIRQIVRLVDGAIPVIANGDIASPEDALRVFEQTGCAAVMIGRGAMGNPFLFRQIAQLTATGRYDLPTPAEKVETARLHTRLMVALKGERVATYEMRKHIGWYIRGLRGAAAMRERTNACTSTSELMEAMEEYMGAVCDE